MGRPSHDLSSTPFKRRSVSDASSNAPPTPLRSIFPFDIFHVSNYRVVPSTKMNGMDKALAGCVSTSYFYRIDGPVMGDTDVCPTRLLHNNPSTFGHRHFVRRESVDSLQEVSRRCMCVRSNRLEIYPRQKTRQCQVACLRSRVYHRLEESSVRPSEGRRPIRPPLGC